MFLFNYTNASMICQLKRHTKPTNVFDSSIDLRASISVISHIDWEPVNMVFCPRNRLPLQTTIDVMNRFWLFPAYPNRQEGNVGNNKGSLFPLLFNNFQAAYPFHHFTMVYNYCQ